MFYYNEMYRLAQGVKWFGASIPQKSLKSLVNLRLDLQMSEYGNSEAKNNYF